ncbi:Serine aminopeptidase S33 [Trinorchestia longiramus]|nr:Serine aminopeptidase S33 [Trinorchestia longiramus]
MATSNPQNETKFLSVGISSGNELHKLAYHEVVGDSALTVLYIPGFTSSSIGEKPKAVFNWCRLHQVSCITYDPTGFGETQGAMCFQMSQWVLDAEEMLTRVARGPVLLVGSSMGAWISCILAERHKDRVRGLLLLSTAFNFGSSLLRYLEMVLPNSELEKFRQGDTIYYDKVPKYGNMQISMAFFEDMKKHDLSMEPGAVKVSCPVRMVHTEKDREAPIEAALQLFKAFDSEDVQLQLMRTGSHSLLEPGCLDVVLDALHKLLQNCGGPSDHNGL